MDLVSGQFYTLKLKKGAEETFDYSERVISGKVQSFEHVERIYDEEHIAVGKTSETRWEILTNDPTYSAIGFLPESVIEAEPLKLT